MLHPDVYDHLLATAAAVSEPLRTAIAQVGPIQIGEPTHANVAERLFVEVVNQQLSTKAAAAIWSRVETAAAQIKVTPRLLLAPGHESTLRACGISGNKVRALQAICVAEAAGLLGPELAVLPHAERSAVLCCIRGVGPWTADMIGIFHFLDLDIWPAGDVAARFAPYRSILARYTWRIRDSAALVGTKAA